MLLLLLVERALHVGVLLGGQVLLGRHILLAAALAALLGKVLLERESVGALLFLELLEVSVSVSAALELAALLAALVLALEFLLLAALFRWLLGALNGLSWLLFGVDIFLHFELVAEVLLSVAARASVLAVAALALLPPASSAAVALVGVVVIFGIVVSLAALLAFSFLALATVLRPATPAVVAALSAVAAAFSAIPAVATIPAPLATIAAAFALVAATFASIAAAIATVASGSAAATIGTVVATVFAAIAAFVTAAGAGALLIAFADLVEIVVALGGGLLASWGVVGGGFLGASLGLLMLAHFGGGGGLAHGLLLLLGRGLLLGTGLLVGVAHRPEAHGELVIHGYGGGWQDYKIIRSRNLTSQWCSGDSTSSSTISSISTFSLICGAPAPRRAFAFFTRRYESGRGDTFRPPVPVPVPGLSYYYYCYCFCCFVSSSALGVLSL